MTPYADGYTGTEEDYDKNWIDPLAKKVNLEDD